MRRLFLASLTLLVSSLACYAGTITIVDNSDNITLQDNTGRAMLTCNAVEACTLYVAPPPKTVSATFGANPGAFFLLDPVTLLPSDEWCLAPPGSGTCVINPGPNFPNGALLAFNSATPGGPQLDACLNSPFCAVETGTPQFAFSLVWTTSDTFNNVITDNIYASSRDTPEPSSILMLLAGLAVLATMTNTASAAIRRIFRGRA